MSADPGWAAVPNDAPSAPTETATSPATTCAGGSYLRTETPVLSARFADPDGDAVAARFEVLVGETPVWDSGYDAAAASGAGHAVTVPSDTLADGATYVWRARGRDTNKRQGAWSSRCQFTIDTTRPELPKVTSATYPEGQVSGGVGVPGTFTFASSSDTTAFRYSFNGATPETVDAPDLGAPASVTLTPASAGSQRLAVEAIDRAGNVSDMENYLFGVTFTSAATYWTMDAGTSPEPNSAPDGAHPLSIPDGIAWIDGSFKSFAPDAFPDDRALEFDGADAGATTAATVLNTAESFTMSAIVRVDDVSSATRVAVSQDGQLFGAAQLGQVAAEDCPAGMTTCFGFWMRSDDSSARTLVVSERPVAAGEWMMLAGVWNATANQMTLYTCAIGTPPSDFPADSGIPSTTSVPFASTGWSADGPVRVGAGWVAGEESQRWNGAIDAVRLHPSVKTESDIGRYCSGSTAP